MNLISCFYYISEQLFMEMIGHPSYHPTSADVQHMKKPNWCQRCSQSQISPPAYMNRIPSPSYNVPCFPPPLASPPPPYTENTSYTSSTSPTSRLVTILTLVLLFLTSITIGLLWKHLELLASLTQVLIQNACIRHEWSNTGGGLLQCL